MIILSIETSCDETAVAILKKVEDKKYFFSFEVLGNALFSQTKIHEKYGGVFPTLAKREHAKNLVPLFLEALNHSSILQNTRMSKDKVKKKDIVDINDSPNVKKISDLKSLLGREPEMWEQFEKHILSLPIPPIEAIAVTNGPGLEPALWVGVNFARALGELWNIPIIPTNHMEGHIAGALIKNEDGIMNAPQIKYPALALLVSGGHTELVLLKEGLKYKIVGSTKDDASGEAFDKSARVLGLPYPGGPEISRLAKMWRVENVDKRPSIRLPRPMLNSGDLNFSFSGLKTALLYTVQKLEKENKISAEVVKSLCAELEDAIVEVLISKTKKAVEEFDIKSVILGGGVSANQKLRDDFKHFATQMGINYFISEIPHSTDNAIMIGASYFMKCNTNKDKIKENKNLKANGNLKIDSVL